MESAKQIDVAPNSVNARSFGNRLAWLGLYAIAMGLLEAICVVYLRRLLPIQVNHPALPEQAQHIEMIREACTIVMLAAVASLAGSNLRSRIECFFFAFGLWDIFYYVGLKWFAGWPSSLLTWDCLFLIPKPWFAPVLAPVLISTYFVIGCCVQHSREARGTAPRWSAAGVLMQAAALSIWFFSFVESTPQIASTGLTGGTYSWPLFGAGLFFAVAGLWVGHRPA